MPQNNRLASFQMNCYLNFFLLKVRELTASLERNLSFGREVKKPAGAVALFDQGPSRQTPPEAVSLFLCNNVTSYYFFVFQ